MTKEMTINETQAHIDAKEFPMDLTYNNQDYTADIIYDLGGYNQFNGEFSERGYYLTVARGNRDEYEVITGGGKLLLNEVTRQSKKQANLAKDLGMEKLAKLVALVDERNHSAERTHTL